MIELGLKVGLSYLLGGLIGALIVGRLRGVDIRRMGSGNPGSTNALRTQGTAFGTAVFLIDAGKGWLATHVIAYLNLPVTPAASWWRAGFTAACALAVLLGHVYPVFHGFKGGKGVATLLGAAGGLDPALFLSLVIAWLLFIALFGYVGLASILAAVSLPIAMAIRGSEPRLPLELFGLCAAGLILYTHRGNLARIRRGREPRAQHLWLAGKLRQRP